MIQLFDASTNVQSWSDSQQKKHANKHQPKNNIMDIAVSATTVPPPSHASPSLSSATASSANPAASIEPLDIGQPTTPTIVSQPPQPPPLVTSPWTLGSIDVIPNDTNNHTTKIPSALHYPAPTESVLAAACSVVGFDIAEVWWRTGAKTHQLTHSHVRPTALEDSVRSEVAAVYYGADQTHRLSPALCKRAKEVGDVVWLTGDALRSTSLSAVGTAVAVPMCHAEQQMNMTVIFFSMRR